MERFLLSIVIPSYNEIPNLKKGVLDEMNSYLEKRKKMFESEVIVVDDGSDDGSREFVLDFAKKFPRFRLLENQHLGKAGAVTAGVLNARGDYVLFSDMDQATPLSEVEKFFPAIQEGYNIVIGSRPKRKGAPLTRIIMSKGVIILRSVLVGLSGIHDTQCGFKLFSKIAAQNIFKKLKKIHQGFSTIHGSSVTAGFDIELLYLGTKNGYRIKEVPVEWRYVETRRVSPLKDSIEGVVELLRIRYNIVRHIYSRV